SHALRPAPDPTLFPYTTLFRSFRIDVTKGSETSPNSLHGSLQTPPPTDITAHSTLTTSPSRINYTPKSHPRASVNALRRHDRARSEEHTSELQSRENLVCRLLL